MLCNQLSAFCLRGSHFSLKVMSKKKKKCCDMQTELPDRQDIHVQV